jgi:hypothetical protein
MTAGEKQRRARGGWFNWYVNRGFIVLTDASDKDLKRAARALSWRRKF